VGRIYEYAGIRPVIDASAFVHPEAVVIGDVIIGAGVYVAPLASLRGDLGRLIIEAGANVQDCCVMHGFPGKDCVIEEDGHVGHGAILHGCRIGRNALVGMNATVMDGAVVGPNAFVAAMAFVKAGFEVPEGHLVAGVPARVVRPLEPSEIAWKGKGTREYQELARMSADTLRPCEPRRAVEPDRPRCPSLTAIRPKLESRS
jgi:phenylacetic acid degradation protein